MISRKFFQLEQQQVCSELFSFLMNRKDIKDQISKIMAQTPASTLLRRLKDVSLIQVPVETSLQRVKLVILTYVPVGTSLQRLKLVGFNQVPVKRCKNVSNSLKNVLLTHQLRRRDDVSAWSLKRINFVWVLGSTFFRHLRWFCLIKLPASTSLQHLSVSFRYQL